MKANLLLAAICVILGAARPAIGATCPTGDPRCVQSDGAASTSPDVFPTDEEILRYCEKALVSGSLEEDEDDQAAPETADLAPEDDEDEEPADKPAPLRCHYNCDSGECMLGRDFVDAEPKTPIPAKVGAAICKAFCAENTKEKFKFTTSGTCTEKSDSTGKAPPNFPGTWRSKTKGVCLGIAIWETAITRCKTIENEKCMTIDEFVKSYGELSCPAVAGSGFTCSDPIPRCIVIDGRTLNSDDPKDIITIIEELQSRCEARVWDNKSIPLADLKAGECASVYVDTCARAKTTTGHVLTTCKRKDGSLCVKDPNCRRPGKDMECYSAALSPNDCKAFGNTGAKDECASISYTCPFTAVEVRGNLTITEKANPFELQCPLFGFATPKTR